MELEQLRCSAADGGGGRPTPYVLSLDLADARWRVRAVEATAQRGTAPVTLASGQAREKKHQTPAHPIVALPMLPPSEASSLHRHFELLGNLFCVPLLGCLAQKIKRHFN